MKTSRWDIIALVSITLVGLASYIAWGHVTEPRVFFVSTLVLTVALSGWTRWLWPRLSLWLTKFFCIAAIFDLMAEGILQPFHGHTVLQKLICQMTLFAAYAIYLVALRPIDVRLASRATTR
jgi:hypothetical protein